MALGPREISDFLEISDFTARQRTPMPRLLHQIADVKFQALDPGVEMPRAPRQKACQASDMPRWAEHMPTQCARVVGESDSRLCSCGVAR